MNIGTKSWNESLTDVFWEVAALLGVTFGICGLIAAGVLVVRILHPR